MQADKTNLAEVIYNYRALRRHFDPSYYMVMHSSGEGNFVFPYLKWTNNAYFTVTRALYHDNS